MNVLSTEHRNIIKKIKTKRMERHRENTETLIKEIKIGTDVSMSVNKIVKNLSLRYAIDESEATERLKNWFSNK